MDWLSAAFWAWFGWHVLAPLAFLLFILVVFVAPGAVARAWKQRRCAHESYRETSACDAICNTCNLNLGFIGTVREERARRTSKSTDTE